MQRFRDVLQDRGGNAVVGASVRVQTYPGAVDATIYSDDGVTVQGNPITTGANGEFSFYAADGRYQLVVTATGYSTRTITDIILEDPAAASAGVFTTLSVSGAATLSSTLAVTGAASFASTVSVADGSASAPSYAFTTQPGTGIFRPASNALGVAFSTLEYARFTPNVGEGLTLRANLPLSWASGALGTTPDVLLYRDAAGVLAQRSGVNAQITRVYNTYTDAANYERLNVGFSANIAYVETSAAGTGAARTLNVGTAGAAYLALRTSGLTRWTVDASGHLIGQAGLNFSVAGNTTLGDSSADALTINAGTWTIGSNWTASRAAGVLPAGTTNIGGWSTTYSGDVGGTSDARSHNFSATASGGNALSSARGMSVTLTHAGSALLNTTYSLLTQLGINSTGGITSHNVYATFINMAGGGNIGTLIHYLAATPSLTAGAITTSRGLRVENQGHASITTAIGVSIADFTGSTTMRGIQSSLSSGAGKHNLYIDGTAVNYLAGQIQAGDGTAAAPAYSFANDPNSGWYYSGSSGVSYFSQDGTAKFGLGGGSLLLASDRLLAWRDGANVAASNTDLILVRDAANILALRNGVSAQAIRVYNTYTDGTNHEYGTIRFISGQFQIGTTAAGTGVARPISLFTNGVNRWVVGATDGHLTANLDNTYDIGASGVTRPRSLYVGTSVSIGFAGVNFTAANADDLRIATNGASRVSVQSGGVYLLTDTMTLGFGSAADTLIARDAANILALRNGVNAQTLHVYNTYTDAANFERARLIWSGNTFYIDTHQDGTGSPRDMNIGTTGFGSTLTIRTAGTNRWQINTDGHLIGYVDNTYDIGGSGVFRPRTGYFGTSVITPAVTAAASGNVDLTLSGAGTGLVRFGTHSAVAAETVTGYITIKDAGGVSRKLAVVS